MPCISDRNKEKVGLRTLGTDIEIISEDAVRKLKPDFMLVIPWNFKDEMVLCESEYIQNGGKLLFVMPYPYYIDKQGEKKI
jgi:NDP-4-keto-2,6-dideoxyhexose 3-C-methyltransferase